MTKSAPVPPPRTTRRVTHTLSDGAILRICDRLAGKRDRPHTDTGHGPVVAVPDLTTRPGPWLPAGPHEWSGLAVRQVVPR